LVGVDPLEGAIRELLEETGLVAKNWVPLLKMHLSNSVSDELAIVYLATDLTQQTAEPEETEQLQIKKLPFETVFEMVENELITDSMTVAAVYKIKLLLLEGKLN
jgi:8-oxo-dGTP pyrophosphatase MutT (NUDIX family)